MSTTHDKERTLQRQIGHEVEAALPGVEVLAVELQRRRPLHRLRRPPGGRRPRALRARHRRAARVPARLRDRRLVAGLERPLRKPEHFRNAVGRQVVAAHAGAQAAQGEVVSAGERAVIVRAGDEAPSRSRTTQIVRGN